MIGRVTGRAEGQAMVVGLALICGLVSVVAIVGGLVAGRIEGGLAIAAGLLIGATNPLMTLRSLDSDLPFQTSSLGRLLLLSVVALGLGLALSPSMVPLVVGAVAASQLLMAVGAAALGAVRS